MPYPARALYATSNRCKLALYEVRFAACLLEIFIQLSPTLSSDFPQFVPLGPFWAPLRVNAVYSSICPYYHNILTYEQNQATL